VTFLLWARVGLLIALAGTAALLVWLAWMDRERPQSGRRGISLERRNGR
jgi:hypothetical protein